MDDQKKDKTWEVLYGISQKIKDLIFSIDEIKNVLNKKKIEKKKKIKKILEKKIKKKIKRKIKIKKK